MQEDGNEQLKVSAELPSKLLFHDEVKQLCAFNQTAGLKHCKSLSSLKLDNDHIGCAGAKGLAEGLLHCGELESR
jgi:hypothetical protein